jgi:hypothetical protein
MNVPESLPAGAEYSWHNNKINHRICHSWYAMSSGELTNSFFCLIVKLDQAPSVTKEQSIYRVRKAMSANRHRGFSISFVKEVTPDFLAHLRDAHPDGILNLWSTYTTTSFSQRESLRQRPRKTNLRTTAIRRPEAGKPAVDMFHPCATHACMNRPAGSLRLSGTLFLWS